MIRRASILIIASMALVGTAKAEGSFLFGIGGRSCAFWLSSAGYKEQGKTWIYGYWSGLNAASQTNRMVGQNTDSDGIVGEIQNVCEAEPSTALIAASDRIYCKLSK
jgi:hypothetical protein